MLHIAVVVTIAFFMIHDDVVAVVAVCEQRILLKTRHGKGVVTV